MALEGSGVPRDRLIQSIDTAMEQNQSYQSEESEEGRLVRLLRRRIETLDPDRVREGEINEPDEAEGEA